MEKYQLNREQKKFLSDFLNSLSVAWFSVGVISPFFIKVDNAINLIVQVMSSISVSAVLFYLGIKNLAAKWNMNDLRITFYMAMIITTALALVLYFLFIKDKEKKKWILPIYYFILLLFSPWLLFILWPRIFSKNKN